MAHRSLFQAHQAKPENQIICRHIRECSANPNMDGATNHPVDDLFENKSQVPMAHVEPGNLYPTQPFCEN